MHQALVTLFPLGTLTHHADLIPLGYEPSKSMMEQDLALAASTNIVGGRCYAVGEANTRKKLPLVAHQTDLGPGVRRAKNACQCSSNRGVHASRQAFRTFTIMRHSE